MREAKFSIDTYGDQVFDGYSTDQEWNGWACPLFTFQQAQNIVSACNQNGGRAFFDEAQDQFIFYLDNISTEPEVYPSEEVEGQQLYPIGSYNWIWEEVAHSIS